ncbi:integrase/recombinase xerD homolog [Saccoglossus kowalevskii]
MSTPTEGLSEPITPPNIKDLLDDVTNNITTVVEDRLSKFKRDLSEENSEALETAAKRARADKHDFKKPGNRQQFEHEQKVMECLHTAMDATTKNAVEKAKDALEKDVFQIQNWKAELSNPALDDFCDTLPDVMLASRAGNTLSKYTGSWLRWKRWCQSNLSAGAACPAKPLHIAIYLRSLLDNANTVAPMDSALYSIRWAHSMAGIESPTCHPMVRATMEGCRRILAKPRKAKEPVYPEILATLVSQKNLSSLSDLRLLCLCLISYAGFMRIGELLSVKISDISFSDSHMEIKLHKRKNDKFREGSSIIIARSPKNTCPVRVTEMFISKLGVNVNSESFLIRRLVHTKQGLKPHNHLGISYSTARDLMMKGIKPLVNDISQFGTHSFRAGGATAAANSNVNERCIARHGGWKSTSSKDRYICDSLQSKLEVSKSLGV